MRAPTTLRQVDIAAGALLTVFGAFVLVQSLQLSFYTEEVPGPGFFPSLLAIGLIVTGVGLVLSRLVVQRMGSEGLELPDRQQATRSLGLWAVIFVACLAVGVLGFLLTMALLVAVLLFVVERRRTIGSVIATIAIPAFAWLLFGWLLQVQLPTGVFGVLFG